jgi:DNA-binding winged helix-turn-helix (wHTH) protein
MRTSFAGFVVDSDTRQVFRGEQPVPISPKAFELLELLIRHRPRALSKSQIHDRLWPKVFVSDASLSNLVAELRSVFEDDARKPRLLRTVQRFGYAFIGDAVSPGRVARPGPSHRLVWEAREIPLPAGDTLFGRDQDAGVWIDDAAVSRRHAQIVVRDGRATLEDLGSKNGTFHNGRRMTRAVELSDGDRIEIGRASMVFRELLQTRSTQTARSKGLERPASGSRRK